MRTRLNPTLFVLCILCPTLAWAGDLSERFTLGRYVPGDAWLYMHGVDNPEKAWIEEQWGKVFDAFKASRIDSDLLSLFLSAVSEDERAEVEARIDKWTGLVKAVHWGELIEKEFVFGERFGQMPVNVEFFALTRGRADRAQANMTALTALLKEFAALDEDIHLADREQDGVAVWTMTFGKKGAKKNTFSFDLFRKGDIIGLTFGSNSLGDIIGLLAGQPDQSAIVANPRFKQAMAQVKSPEDMVVFFDAKAMFTDLESLMDKIAEKKAKQADSDAQHALETKKKSDEHQAVSLVAKVMNLFDVVDYTITTIETEGRRELTHEVVRFQPEKKQSPFASACLNRKPFERFDRFIPAEATGFNMTGLIDLEGIYKIVLDFIKTGVPDGEKAIEEWNGFLASTGFDPQRDLFSWWSGEMISVTLPAEVVTPMSGADWVWMIRVKDEAVAKEKINGGVGWARGRVQAHNQMLMSTPATVNGEEGFRQLTHPMLAMFLRPVIGVKGDWLMIGSSSGAIGRCLNVSAGQAASIIANERFKKEGIMPEGPVMAASFTDTSKLGEELSGVVSMIGMIGGMTMGMAPHQPGQPVDKEKQMIQRLMSTLMKLGPVLQKINFYSSESSVTTHDGEGTMRTVMVTTYKSPSPTSSKTTQAP